MTAHSPFPTPWLARAPCVCATLLSLACTLTGDPLEPARRAVTRAPPDAGQTTPDAGARFGPGEPEPPPQPTGEGAASSESAPRAMGIDAPTSAEADPTRDEPAGDPPGEPPTTLPPASEDEPDCADACPEEPACAPEGCADAGSQNDASTPLEDGCGDGLPSLCEIGEGCAADADCTSSRCRAQTCVGELGSPCTANGQCESANCDGVRCQPPASCTDGLRNGDEGGVDCGGSDPECPRCTDGRSCGRDSDCVNDNCFEDVCISCGSGVVDGDETDVDCGGNDPACQRCRDGQRCLSDSDCGNDNCFEGVCISCGSGVVDGDETDVDCGGNDPACQRCRAGQSCIVNGDCQSGFCSNGRC